MSSLNLPSNDNASGQSQFTDFSGAGITSTGEDLNLTAEPTLIIDESKLRNFNEFVGNTSSTIGIPGQKGDTGEALDFIGIWDSNIVYVRNQAVGYNGSTYVWVNTSRDSTLTDIPDANPSTGWELAVLGGIPGIVYVGNWQALQQYEYGDVVSINGSSYIYINATPSCGNIVTDLQYFSLLAGKGDDGQDGAGSSVLESIYGFVSVSLQDVVFSTTTRKYHIIPSASEYSFYISGVKFTKSLSIFINVPTSLSGWIYFFFDINGNLSFSQTKPSNVTELRITDIYFQNDLPLFETRHFRTINYGKNDFEIHNVSVKAGLEVYNIANVLSMSSGQFISDMNFRSIDQSTDLNFDYKIIVKELSNALTFKSNFNHIIEREKYFSSFIIINPNNSTDLHLFFTNPELYYTSLTGAKLNDKFDNLDKIYFPEHFKVIFRVLYYIDTNGIVTIQDILDLRFFSEYQIDNEIILQSSGDKNHIEQLVAVNQKTIVHELGKFPAVSIIDISGLEVEGKVEIIDDFTVYVEFNDLFSGYIILN